MPGKCPECGASVTEGGSCRDNFHALLALEWDVPGGAGGIAHFFAVSAYGLQHPDSMRYTTEAFDWLRSAVDVALATDCSVESLRLSARAQGGVARVTRREGDAVPGESVESWTLNVEEILAGGTDGYGARVRRWAAAVIGDIGSHRR